MISMMTRPERRAERPTRWKRKWMVVPVRFCSGVCVGWRISAAWVTTRRPAELRRGCAEKKMSLWEKMAPQMMAARIQIPAWAMAAVPVGC